MRLLDAVWSSRWTLLPLILGGWNVMQRVRRVENRDASHWFRARWYRTVAFVAAVFWHLGWWRAVPAAGIEPAASGSVDRRSIH